MLNLWICLYFMVKWANHSGTFCDLMNKKETIKNTSNYQIFFRMCHKSLYFRITLIRRNHSNLLPFLYFSFISFKCIMMRSQLQTLGKRKHFKKCNYINIENTWDFTKANTYSWMMINDWLKWLIIKYWGKKN